ncbi:anthranilate synthase component I family protein [Breznakibacter xylanolyticus]|nr:anthranilate synthase component I family protein [Breznakibacter xylanolyticus]
MREFLDIKVDDPALVRVLLVNETERHAWAMLLETLPGNGLEYPGGASLHCLAAFGCIGRVGGDLHAVQQFRQQHRDWLTGYIGYDYKNKLEALSSTGHDGVDFDDLCWVQPRYLILQHDRGWQLGYHTAHDDEASARLWWQGVMAQQPVTSVVSAPVALVGRIDRQAYLDAVAAIKAHIARGDIYEMNYCTEFSTQGVSLNVADVYLRLTEASPMPFSALLKDGERVLVCASPERFLQVRAGKVISQPIKGTVRRGVDAGEDALLSQALKADSKERAENVMIADLVRNDLSRVARRGSVQVEELCGVYAFRQLHQMITTVTATLTPGKTWADAVAASFPPGSMTGAPKVRAMQLIDRYEPFRRGLYSGAVGYVTPEGDCDLNVVIRSIQYNAATGYASYITGSAITHLCDPAREYDECLLKGRAMREVLAGK